MRAIGLTLLLLPAALTPAQTTKPDLPLRLELGAFLPNYRGADFGHDAGPAVSLGYDVVRRDALVFGASLRGALHISSLGGGGDSGVGADEGNIALGALFVDARYQPQGCRLFGGLGIGVGQVGIEDGPNRTGLLLAVEGGFQITTALYVAARYQHAGPDALRGATVSLGFRF